MYAAQVPPAHQARSGGARVELSFEFQIHVTRTCVDDDDALGEVPIARRGNTADDLHAFERAGGNLSQVDAAARRSGEAEFTDHGLQVGVIGDGHAVENDGGAERRQVAGERPEPRARGGAGCGNRAERDLLQTVQAGGLHRHTRDQLQHAREAGGGQVFYRFAIDDAGGAQLAAGASRRVGGDDDAFHLERAHREPHVALDRAARRNNELHAHGSVSNHEHAQHLRSRRQVDQSVAAVLIRLRSYLRTLDARNGAGEWIAGLRVDHPTGNDRSPTPGGSHLRGRTDRQTKKR